jgi:hypothetical protein
VFDGERPEEMVYAALTRLIGDGEEEVDRDGWESIEMLGEGV